MMNRWEVADGKTSSELCSLLFFTIRGVLAICLRVWTEINYTKFRYCRVLATVTAALNSFSTRPRSCEILSRSIWFLHFFHTNNELNFFQFHIKSKKFSDMNIWIMSLCPSSPSFVKNYVTIFIVSKFFLTQRDEICDCKKKIWKGISDIVSNVNHMVIIDVLCSSFPSHFV